MLIERQFINKLTRNESLTNMKVIKRKHKILRMKPLFDSAEEKHSPKLCISCYCIYCCVCVTLLLFNNLGENYLKPTQCSRTLLIRHQQHRGHDRNSKQLGLSQEHIYLHDNVIKQLTKLIMLCFTTYKITIQHNQIHIPTRKLRVIVRICLEQSYPSEI